MAAYIATGKIGIEMPPLAVVKPAMLVPTLLGVKLYIGIGESTFRKIVLSLPTASGIGLLASALPHVAGQI